MAILLKEHEGIEDVLIHIQKQIFDSYEYAKKQCPQFETPEQLFYYLKERVTYLDDPASIELIMTMQTFMRGTRTGVPGGGDCDDFTITAMACLHACGFQDNEIVLAGRTKKDPVHIYCRTWFNGQWNVFDLTEDEYNQEREYNYYQYLQIT